MIAIEITEASWFLHDESHTKIGVIVKHLDTYMVITTDGYISYDSLSKLENKYGQITFKEREVIENKEVFIADFPIDASDVYDIDEHSEIPSYKKTPTSKVRYAAGYWGVKYSDQYVQAFCPKITTLQSYEYIGPFKSKFLLRDEMLVANKRLNNES